MSSFFQGAYWGHSKVAAPGMLSTTGRTLAIGNCKDGSLRSVLTWDVGPGLAPAQAVPSCGRGGPTFKLGHYCSLGNPGVYLHDPAVWSPSIASPAGRRYVHVPLARISHHRGKGRPPERDRRYTTSLIVSAPEGWKPPFRRSRPAEPPFRRPGEKWQSVLRNPV